ncbi:stage II sporulation protein M [Methanosalsum natronophilum]|uniref:Stage II sporulation protein M n=1 Tax=Methanosalsum natronophilum TaxID=768733 RepID=A0A3R7VWZ9_9EURY|nr:stage II sporulation protein M [Methanosalsum natronophilum]MCS3923050.1 stage II sporulation protein M [Methanosalsum natronophilum]RQD82692.1 MAG: stage II sporulation protein M [Methanosalsum natronophilum]
MSENRFKLVKEYLQHLNAQILIMIALFFISAILGYIYSAASPEFATEALGGLEEIVEMIEGLHPIIIMLFIFFNNAFVALIALLLGIAFGIIPLIIIAYNGIILGVVARLVAEEIGLTFLLAGILPHGVIELPVVFISAAIGLKIGQETLNAVLGKEANIKNELDRGLRFYIKWIVPLLFIAAFIETFITPLLIYAVGV